MKYEQDIYPEPLLRVVVINELAEVISEKPDVPVLHAIKKQQQILLPAPSGPLFNDYRIKAKQHDPL